MKQTGLLSLFLIILFFSCGTGPKQGDPVPADTLPPAETAVPVVSAPPPEPLPVETVQPDPPPVAPAPEPKPMESESFNPETITEEKFTATKADVQTLIADLNRIIRARNYNTWLTYLSDSYFEKISSSEFLAERTEELYKRDQIVDSNLGRDPRRTQKKILRTPRDYFNNVVVPSRSNDRMDDIDFVSENRVKAYTIDSRGQRLVLYDLEMIDNGWKIIN